MKKWIAAAAATVVISGLSACGNDDSDVATETLAPPTTATELTDWRAVGQAGLAALDECSNDSDAVMYACDHYKFIEITARMSSLPRGDSDIRNVMGAFQDDYVKRWAPRRCGTEEADETLLCNRQSMEMVLSQARKGFQNLADGKPV